MSTMRSTTWRFLAMLLFASVVMTSAVLAHHGWTGYNENKTLTINGVITEASYANPHGTVRIQAAGDNKVWLAVLAPPSRMSSRGLSQEMLRVGATATIVGYPHLKNADEMRAERITIADKTIELR